MKDFYTEEHSDELIVLDFVAGMTDNFATNSVSDILIPNKQV